MSTRHNKCEPIQRILLTCQQAIKQFRETTSAEQIAILEDQKILLLEQRSALQRKLDAFDERVRERELEKQRRARRSA